MYYDSPLIFVALGDCLVGLCQGLALSCGNIGHMDRRGILIWLKEQFLTKVLFNTLQTLTCLPHLLFCYSRPP